MMTKRREKKQGGFISAELGIGIVVVSILTVGGFLIAQNLENDRIDQQFLSQHRTLSTSVLEAVEMSPSIFTTAADNADVTEEVSGFVPDRFLEEDDLTEIHTASGVATVVKVTEGTGDEAEITAKLIMPSPKERCSGLAGSVGEYVEKAECNAATNSVESYFRVF